MASKTFKIGEYARGGVITAETKGNKVTLIAKLWDTSTGYNKNSNQSNAKEMHRIEVDATDSEAYWKLFHWASEESTSYWADEILKWVKTKSKLNDKNSMW
jgi:hypothetical protein